jgi:signal peptidase I
MASKKRDQDRVEDPKAKAGEAPAKPTLQGFDWWRENLEAVIVALILALIIRHFSLESFEIPTGSMAPTLFGIHASSTCPNCPTTLHLGLQSDSDTGELSVGFSEREVYDGRCPRCSMSHQRSFSEGGGRVLIPGKEVFTCDNSKCKNRWTGDAGDFSRMSVATRFAGTELSRDVILTCPNCWLHFRDVITRKDRNGGHKILVNKFIYRLGKPRRWDVIVFHFDEKKNYIKRLLALPGEKAWIRGGDLYVQGPGDPEPRIQGKRENPPAREALWFTISDSGLKEKGYNPQPAWKEVFESGSGIESELESKWWQWDPSALRWTANVLEPAARVAALRYNRPCVNYYDYNRLSVDLIAYQSLDTVLHRSTQVGDKKVSFTARPSGAREDAWIGGEIRDGDFTYQFRIPVGKTGGPSRASLRRLPTDLDSYSPSPKRPPPPELAGEAATSDAVLALLKPARIEFENADDRVAVSVDGKEILALEYRSGSPDDLREDQHYLTLLASGVTASFESIKVFRDVHYTYFPQRRNAGFTDDMDGPQKSVTIGSIANGGDDEYFPCGDNSPSSLDGRAWGTAPERNLMGRAFVIFWPLSAWGLIH